MRHEQARHQEEAAQGQVVQILYRADIRSLAKNDISRHLDAFQAIAADMPGEDWVEEHFLRDFPEKWHLSFAAWDVSDVVAYAILSRKSTTQVHLHRLMVTESRRGQGMGAKMVKHMDRHVCGDGYTGITLKVHENNNGARRFYRRMGFKEAGHKGEYFVMEKLLGVLMWGWPWSGGRMSI